VRGAFAVAEDDDLLAIVDQLPHQWHDEVPSTPGVPERQELSEA
jgi:hypothetical protein